MDEWHLYRRCSLFALIKLGPTWHWPEQTFSEWLTKISNISVVSSPHFVHVGSTFANSGI